MNQRKSVTYRLAVAGDRAVFGQMAKIAEAGESSAKRLGRAYEKDLRIAEASVGRLERRAQQLLTLGGSDIQRRIAASTGLDAGLAGGGQAQQSMQVFIQQQDELARARGRLLAQFDPLVAAQQRYNQVLAEANRLRRQGVLNEEEFSQVQARATAEMQSSTQQYEAATKMNSAYRVGIQQAGFQVSDFAVQIAGGTSAIRAASLQVPQFVQALSLMGSGTNKSTGALAAMTRVLAGPWGSALTVAVSILGAMATRLLDTEKATDKASDANLTLAERLDFVKQGYDAAIEAARAYAKETSIAAQTSLDQAQNSFLAAQALFEEAKQRRTSLAALLDEQLNGERQNIIGTTPGSTIRAESDRNRSPRITQLEALISANDAALKKAEAGLNASQFKLNQERVRIQTDSSAAIVQAYEAQITAVKALGLAEEEELRRLVDIERRKKAALDALRERTGGGRRGRGTRSELAEERERLREIQANFASGRRLAEAGDPLLGIRNRRDDELKEILRLAGLKPRDGGIGSEQADILRRQARERASSATSDLFDRSFSDLADGAAATEEDMNRRRQFMQDLIRDQEFSNRLLDAEFDLVGATAEERDQALSRIELTNALLEAGVDIEGRKAIAVLATNDALVARDNAVRRANELLEEQLRIGENLIDTVFNVDNWRDWGDTGKRILRELIQEMLILAAVNPLKNALLGTDLPVLSAIPGFAAGTMSAPGGLATVGEFGKELVRLPRGAQVLNASQTRAMERSNAGARMPTVFNLSADGADPEQLQRLVEAVRELDANLERRAVEAAVDLNERTFGAAFAGV